MGKGGEEEIQENTRKDYRIFIILCRFICAPVGPFTFATSVAIHSSPLEEWGGRHCRSGVHRSHQGLLTCTICSADSPSKVSAPCWATLCGRGRRNQGCFSEGGPVSRGQSLRGRASNRPSRALARPQFGRRGSPSPPGTGDCAVNERRTGRSSVRQRQESEK